MNLRNIKYVLRGEMRRNYSMANIASDFELQQSCRDVGNAIKAALQIIEREEQRCGKKNKNRGA